jgi:hypothetical protein
MSRAKPVEEQFDSSVAALSASLCDTENTNAAK